jgi:hypothetical protein
MMADEIRTVNLNLGNAAEANMVAINPAHVGHVKLMGSLSSTQRKMEIYMLGGAVIGMSFDDPELAEEVFTEVLSSISRTIPDHVRGTNLRIPPVENG